MSQYYRRQFELFIGLGDLPFIAATNDRQFRVVFNILTDTGAFNSYADIAIYGLSRETEAKVFQRGQAVEFRAGYEQTIDTIFKGQIVNIFREKQGVDRITRMLCRSSSTQVSSSSINKSFEEGVTVQAIIEECAKSMGLPIVLKAADFSDKAVYASGYVLSCDPKTALNNLARAHDFTWAIEKERIIVVGDNSFRDGVITQISALTGMVGSPEITEVGCDVVIKLNPQAVIGAQFKINSEFPQASFGAVYFNKIKSTIGEGTYSTLRLTHSGDSYGDEWITKLTGFGGSNIEGVA